jgi:hypothetical protein
LHLAIKLIKECVGAPRFKQAGYRKINDLRRFLQLISPAVSRLPLDGVEASLVRPSRHIGMVLEEGENPAATQHCGCFGLLN